MVGSTQTVPAISLALSSRFWLFGEQGYRNVEGVEDESREPTNQRVETDK